jgi:HNH endonuclease
MFGDDKAMTSEQRCSWWNTRWAYKPAFTARATNGYPRGAIWGWQSNAHRVCWAIHYGEWPRHEIDHINGDTSDNRMSNLRDTTQNQRNKCIDPRNRSGVCGVSKEKGKWRARISHGGKWLHLGFFADFADAVKARKEAESRFGYHENHGRA